MVVPLVYPLTYVHQLAPSWKIEKPEFPPCVQANTVPFVAVPSALTQHSAVQAAPFSWPKEEFQGVETKDAPAEVTRQEAPLNLLCAVLT
jgi:hypothetical protein